MTETRMAARVVLIDDAGRTLLFQEHDPEQLDRGDWWITPGGAVDGDESFASAARRELQEETGLEQSSLVGPIGTNEFTMELRGRVVHQSEQIFAARGDAADVMFEGWTEFELSVLRGAHWWHVEELQAAGVRFYPLHLPELVREAQRLLLAR